MPGLEFIAQEGQRVVLQRHAHMGVVLHHLLTGGHGQQGRVRLFHLGHQLSRLRRGRRKQRQGIVAERLDRPQGVAAGQAKSLQEGVGLGQSRQGSDGRHRPSPQVVDAGEGLIPAVRHQPGRIPVGQAPHHAQSQPHRELVLPLRGLEGAVPSRGVDADRPHLDPVLAGVPHDLGRGVEAHRLGVEQGGAEDIGMPAFEPGGGVGDQGERRRMAFREAVGSEAFQLAEGLLRELGRIAPLDHPSDQLVLEVADPAGEFEGRHGAAQLIGFRRREPRAFDRHPHRLLLEQGHAERLAQNLLQFRLGKDDRLLALAAPQVRMDHVALNGSRSHDGDLDHQVIEGARLDARQHGHLRAAFDLEDPEGVGLPDHGVGPGILGRDGGQVQVHGLVLAQQVETAPHAAEHAQRQHIDLHELQGVDVVLVPFDHLTILHRRRLDGHEIVQAVVGQNEPAGMLGQVAREPDQLA